MGMAAEPQFHVLAVDDSLTDRKLIERLLKTLSYQVTTVDSGSKALEFLGLQEEDEQQEVEVNLIITDYCMPGMTGYDLLKKVKESSVFRNIPVVIMSSENVPSRITRCLEEGAEEFFLKPVRLSDVNRLRPHMLRAKHRQQRQDLLHECQKPEPKPERQHHEQQCEQPELKTERRQPCEQQPEPIPKQRPEPNPKQQQQQQQQCQQQHEQPLGHQTDRQQQRCQQQYELVFEHQIEQQQEQYEQQVLEHQTEQQQQQQQQQNNDKRKSMDEGFSQDRSRPRYNGITTMV